LDHHWIAGTHNNLSGWTFKVNANSCNSERWINSVDIFKCVRYLWYFPVK
jgi:hypothetical protein